MKSSLIEDEELSIPQSYKINIMAADDLATQAAWISVTVVLA